MSTGQQGFVRQSESFEKALTNILPDLLQEAPKVPLELRKAREQVELCRQTLAFAEGTKLQAISSANTARRAHANAVFNLEMLERDLAIEKEEQEERDEHECGGVGA